MKLIKLFYLTGLLLILTLPDQVLSQSIIKLGGREYPIFNEMPVIIKNNNLSTTPSISYTKYSPDKRYKFIKFLPIFTQEIEIQPPPAPRQLYRLVQVYDQQTGKILSVAVPIKF